MPRLSLEVVGNLWFRCSIECQPTRMRENRLLPSLNLFVKFPTFPNYKISIDASFILDVNDTFLPVSLQN